MKVLVLIKTVSLELKIHTWLFLSPFSIVKSSWSVDSETDAASDVGTFTALGIKKYKQFADK